MSTLTPQELNLIRNVRLHQVLSLPDNGRMMKMKCPFHSERTPSFAVYPDNSYHCYGCGKNGQGAIDFCVDLGYSFVEAVEELIKYI